MSKRFSTLLNSAYKFYSRPIHKFYIYAPETLTKQRNMRWQNYNKVSFLKNRYKHTDSEFDFSISNRVLSLGRKKNEKSINQSGLFFLLFRSIQ